MILCLLWQRQPLVREEERIVWGSGNGGAWEGTKKGGRIGRGC